MGGRIVTGHQATAPGYQAVPDSLVLAQRSRSPKLNKRTIKHTTPGSDERAAMDDGDDPAESSAQFLEVYVWEYKQGYMFR